MKTNSRMIVLLMTMVATDVVYGQANLLPNGDFSDAIGIQGWTLSGSGSSGFASDVDAENSATSGSLYLFPNSGTTPAVATSTCFPVKTSANFIFGGKVGSGNDTFEGTSGQMNCKSFSDSSCTSGEHDLGSISNGAPSGSSGDIFFSTFFPAQGLLSGSAVAAQCTVSAVDDNPLEPFPSYLYFDDLYFELQSSTSTAVNLGGYLSGSWYDPATSGQGFEIEFTAQANTVLATWFTYSPDNPGMTQWVYGQGTYDPTQTTVTIPAVLTSGTGFIPNFVKADVKKTPWGNLTFSFTDCNHATVSWTSTLPGYGSGTEQLQRLTSIAGTSCPQ